MSKLVIYHGSNEVIKKPLYGYGKNYNDYGQGFYTTESLELAKEWACTGNYKGFANKYEIETKGLKILNLSNPEFNVLNWLAILVVNRKVNVSTPISNKGKQYLIKNFLPDYKDYDIIVGYRADDSYFSFVRSFLLNEISLKQLSYSMKLGKLGEQVVLKSKKAFDSIKFIDYEEANNSIYYEKKMKRDADAKLAFEKELEKEDINGIFMRDILRQS